MMFRLMVVKKICICLQVLDVNAVVLLNWLAIKHLVHIIIHGASPKIWLACEASYLFPISKDSKYSILFLYLYYVNLCTPCISCT